jgi:hypothetical protein
MNYNQNQNQSQIYNNQGGSYNNFGQQSKPAYNNGGMNSYNNRN